MALERSQLQFGDVLVGEQVEQAVQLLNQGLVPADFCVKPLPASDGVADDTIRVSPTRSELLRQCLRYILNAHILFDCPHSLLEFRLHCPRDMPLKVTHVYPKELAIFCLPAVLFSGCANYCCTLRQMAPCNGWQWVAPQPQIIKEQMHESVTFDSFGKCHKGRLWTDAACLSTHGVLEPSLLIMP